MPKADVILRIGLFAALAAAGAGPVTPNVKDRPKQILKHGVRIPKAETKEGPPKSTTKRKSMKKVDRKQADRARKRRATMAKLDSVPVTVGGLSFLEGKRISQKTKELYAESSSEFRVYAGSYGLSLANCKDVDIAFLAYFDFLYAKGVGIDAARRAYYGHNFYPTKLTKPNLTFNRAANALSSWSKNAPGEDKAGTPWEAACRLSEDLYERGLKDLSAGVMLHFDTIVRPHKILALRRKDLFPPNSTNEKTAFWGVETCPQELGKATKQGEWDTFLLLDEHSREQAKVAARFLHGSVGRKDDRCSPTPSRSMRRSSPPRLSARCSAL